MRLTVEAHRLEPGLKPEYLVKSVMYVPAIAGAPMSVAEKINSHVVFP